ncbi:MAG: 3-hydroxybutyryl-CoA dehydrogenase [Actinobacteria bacterium]|nr:MAG: 3-hydroxybutyryl-CoA dehydrogenase [Actinomycetota bacterium]RIK04891.1 MAG: 3-hydroxybutyryl-CoA dehydrogenase [Acidobacteriota bacterium]
MNSVGILGSGIMGSGIAEVTAKAGIEVILRSRKQETAAAMIAGLDKSLSRQVDKGKLEPAEREQTLALVTATDHIGDLVDCDLIIESVVEDLDVKRALFAELDNVVKPDAILVSNTSTFPVTELAACTSRPDKVCGLHFFNPAPLMALVEVVRPLTASDETIGAAVAFAEKCGKNPVEVSDRAGFIVNALLFPYLNNAVAMLESGTASLEDIDSAMKNGCNFPLGPFALMDLIGLDTTVAIIDALRTEFGDPSYSCHPRLRRMVTAGYLGRKSGRGFYDYSS